MPPGVWHMVYTPVGGMTSGGHFLMYDTMHLTYLSRMYDASPLPGQNGQKPTMQYDYATNEAQSIYRQVLRMVLALTQVSYASRHTLRLFSEHKY